MSSPALSRDRIPAPAAQDRPLAPAPALPLHSNHAVPPVVRRIAGRYRYDRRRGSWWWSPEMFALNGLPAGTVEASTELLLEHLHPEDRPRTLAAITEACSAARPFTVRTRVLRADGRFRSVVLLGEPETEEDGEVIAVQGMAIDLGECAQAGDVPDRTVALEAEVAQMRAAMASRATIEQAKGILMLLTGCNDQVAFGLLTHISSHTHRKVREVAESITESAAGRSRLPEDVRAIIRDACPPTTQRR
jgi:hypothetical protein